MRTALKRLAWLFVVAAALSGCTHPGSVVERAVENPIPPLPPGVYDLKAVDKPPASTREVEPEYPQEIWAALSGKATVVFTVQANGTVKQASIVSADDILFGEAAIAAILQWHFRPAELNGSPVNCRMTMPFYFSILSGGVETDE